VGELTFQNLLIDTLREMRPERGGNGEERHENDERVLCVAEWLHHLVAKSGRLPANVAPGKAARHLPRKRVFASHKVSLKSFYRSQLPPKAVNLPFAITYIKNKLTDLCGNWLFKNKTCV